MSQQAAHILAEAAVNTGVPVVPARPWAHLTDDQLQAGRARALRAEMNHEARGLFHFAKLCGDRAVELDAECQLRGF